MIAECKIDYRDFNYGLDGTTLGFYKDIYLFLESDSVTSITNLNFQFDGGTVVSIVDSRINDKTIKWWHQVGRTNSQGSDPIHPGSPNKGLFKSLSGFTTLPIYATDYGASKHLNPGDIDLNLKIVHNISTRDTLIDTITNITVKKKAFMQLDTGITFNMITPIFGYNNLIVEDSATLVLNSNGKIKIYNPNRITLKYQSNLTFHPNSEMRFINGGAFCNEGGKVRGPGNSFEKDYTAFVRV
ncbi:MAG: hypothetical protein IPM38_18870 [Ignavibacteria bacterium]|nr:hypothetical protein [Ignavibacteria bacterium]